MFPQNLEDQTLEAMWGHYKSALDFTVREVLGNVCVPRNHGYPRLLLLLSI